MDTALVAAKRSKFLACRQVPDVNGIVHVHRRIVDARRQKSAVRGKGDTASNGSVSCGKGGPFGARVAFPDDYATFVRCRYAVAVG